MSTSIPEDVAQVTAEVLRELALQYPLLGKAADGLQLLQGCEHYFRLLSSAAMLDDEVDQARVKLLFELAAITDDPAAPVLLIGSFLSLCEERTGRITPAPVRKRAIHDMASVSRQMVVEAIARAEEAGLTDGATGLLNRDGAFLRLQALLQEDTAAQPDPPAPMAVLCIDVRHALESIGQQSHPVQEALMRALGTRLQAGVRKRDVVARLGPLQLLVLLPGLRHAAQAQIAANQLHALVQMPTQVGERLVTPAATLGIAIWPAHGTRAEELIYHASLAASEAARVSEPYLEFREELASLQQDDSAIWAELQEAIANNATTLHYQPQLDLASGKVTSAEALLRWRRSNGEWTTPDRTLSLTGKRNELKILSEYLVKAAVLQMADWRKKGLEIAVAVNLPANLLGADLPEFIRSVLLSWELPPAQLKIEITEGSMIRFGSDMEAAREVLQALKKVGVRLAIDDFGTGYSSLAWLRQLPLDELKIDQMFVRNLMQTPKDRVIVPNVVRLAHELGMAVVVEGVEDLATQQFITDLRCEKLQGYVFSKPLPAEEFTAFAQARQ